jgi:hypothetical protein
MTYLTKNPLALAALAAAGFLHSAPCSVVSLDFESADQYDLHFFEQQRGANIAHDSSDDANSVAGDGGFVRASYSSFGAGIVIYDTIPDGTPTELFAPQNLAISALFRVSASGRRLGFNFAPSRTDAITVDFQPNFNGTADTLRVAAGANLTSSSEASNTGVVVFETSADTTHITTGRWLQFEVSFSLVNDDTQLQVAAAVYAFNTLNDITSGRFVALEGTHTFDPGQFLAPGEIAVRMNGASASMTADFDNFVIIPEPAAFHAVLGGIVWMLTFRRRRIG